MALGPGDLLKLTRGEKEEAVDIEALVDEHLRQITDQIGRQITSTEVDLPTTSEKVAQWVLSRYTGKWPVAEMTKQRGGKFLLRLTNNVVHQ